MERVKRKRIEVFAEAALQRRLTKALDAQGVSGWSVLPLAAGRGTSGAWTREGQISAAGEMIALICLTREDRAEAVIEALMPILATGVGLLSVGEVEVVRGEKF